MCSVAGRTKPRRGRLGACVRTVGSCSVAARTPTKFRCRPRRLSYRPRMVAGIRREGAGASEPRDVAFIACILACEIIAAAELNVYPGDVVLPANRAAPKTDIVRAGHQAQRPAVVEVVAHQSGIAEDIDG